MRLYRALLHLYPSSFRHEYGEEMTRLFAERRRSATAWHRLSLWTEALSDALATAPRIHLDMLRQDLRYTWRSLSRARGFAATAILVMAVGIGATTAAFSLTDRVLLRPLPFPDPDRLVQVWERVPGYPMMEPSAANFTDWRAMATSFEGLAAHGLLTATLIVDEPERVTGATVTANLFPLLGMQPALGRTFREDEDRQGADRVVVLSDRLWRRVFGAAATAVGSHVRINDDTYTVVGVMPPDFHYPQRETELWIPMRIGPRDLEDRDNNSLYVVGRLARSVSLTAARTEMDAVMASLERSFPKENADSRATVRLLSDQVPSSARVLINALAGASACLLLIACSNLASLLLTRVLSRRRELIVRAALGAGRERLMRQLLTENLVLSAAGGALGVLLAATLTPILVRLVPSNLPVAEATVLDVRVLLFAAGTAVATGLLFGVLPAMRAWRGDRTTGLREGPRDGSAAGERLRSGFVLAQIAASVVLLVAAGLLMRALVRVQSVDPGFNYEQVLTARTTPQGAKYQPTSARTQFYERVLSDVRAFPEVRAAAYTSFAPLTMRGGIWPVEIPGLPQTMEDGSGHRASLRFVTPEYFAALEIPLLAGRDVSDADAMSTQAVAVVSASFAQRYWPAGDALGRTFTFAFRERTIVGIAGDVRVRGLERIAEPQVYLPYKQVPDGALTFYAPKDILIRTDGDPLRVGGMLRDVIRRADPELPVTDVRPMSALVALDTASRSTQVSVLAIFATMALLLAGIGIHGLLAYTVNERRREIGVRVALGATRGMVVRLIAMRSARLAATAGLLGITLGYAAGRQLQSVLAGVAPWDPLTFVAAAVLALAATASGTLIPAIRAVRVDPSRVLRAE